MNKIDIIYNNFNYSFIIDKYKVFYGNNFRDKFNIIKCFKQYFYKNQYSDYSNEYSNRTNIKIDEKSADVKNTFFYELSYNYDLTSDSKLSTKSLILKYLELYLENIEFNDEFNTIKVLLDDFVSLNLKDLIDIQISENINMELKLSDINSKTIIKLIEPIVLKDSLEINNYDLTYEDIYIVQLKILERIAHKLNKELILIADIPLLTKNIVKCIDTLNNINLIIFTNNYNDSINIEKYVLVDFNMLDLENEESINDFIMNLPWHSTIEQFKSKIKESLNKFNFEQLFLNKVI